MRLLYERIGVLKRTNRQLVDELAFLRREAPGSNGVFRVLKEAG